MSLIDRVIGEVAKIDKDSVVVMVGGIGLHIRATRGASELIEKVGSIVTLFTHLIIREDEWTLYGFASEEERALFETLITINGVGPRTGQAILSTLSAENLRAAVMRDQPEILTRVPGIGKKTADKIVFELKNKMKAAIVPELSPVSDVDSEVLSALTSLGYSVVEAQSAIQSIPRDAPKDVESRILIALQYFS
jgi:Holliday junction DNA helicase RuvA